MFGQGQSEIRTIKIVLKTKKPASLLKDKKIKHALFSNCYIWDTFEINLEEHNGE